MGLLDWLPNNFKYIAQKITMCAIHLEKKHSTRFNCDSDLFIAAGVVQADDYWLRTGKIDIKTFIPTLKDLGPHAALLDVIVAVECQMFAADSPMRADTIHNSVHSERRLIEKTIAKTIAKGKTDSMRAQGVDAFMTHAQFAPIRDLVGIQS